MFAWVKPPMLPTTADSIDAYFDRTAPEAKGAGAGGLPGLSAAPRADRRRIRRDVLCSRVGVRRCVQRARADLRLPVRPRRVEPARARPRRDARQRDRARPAQLFVVPGSQAAPAGSAGCSRRWAGACSAPGWTSPPASWDADWPRYDAQRRAAPASSDRPATTPWPIPTPSGARRGRVCTDRTAGGVALVGVAPQVVQEPLEQPLHHRLCRRSCRAGLPCRWASSPSPRSGGSRRRVRHHPVVLGERGDARSTCSG